MNRESERKRLVREYEKMLKMGDAPIGEHWHCGISTKLVKDTLELLKNAIVPPVKVGEKVYFTYNNNVYDLTIEKIVQKESGLFLVDKQFNDWYSVEEIGKTVFTSREDAEKALEGVGRSEQRSRAYGNL